MSIAFSGLVWKCPYHFATRGALTCPKGRPAKESSSGPSTDARPRPVEPDRGRDPCAAFDSCPTRLPCPTPRFQHRRVFLPNGDRSLASARSPSGFGAAAHPIFPKVAEAESRRAEGRPRLVSFRTSMQQADGRTNLDPNRVLPLLCSRLGELARPRAVRQRHGNAAAPRGGHRV